MNVSEALIEIRNKTNDRDEVGLDETEVLSYLNEAVQYVSNFMVGSKSPILVKDLEITEEFTSIPKNFSKFAGTFPVCRSGNTWEALDELPFTVRYFATTGRLEMTDEMPFDYYPLNQIAIKLACIYASAQQKLDISQDKAILDEINTAIVAALTEE